MNDASKRGRRGWAALQLVVITLLAAGAGSCQKHPSSGGAPATKPAASAYDADYVGALATVDRFCHAWLQRNLTVARNYMSRALAGRYPDSRYVDAIVGPAEAHHAGFEVLGGRRSADGRFEFQVRLFWRYVSQLDDRIEAPLERVVVVNEGGQWRVESFPLLE